MRTGSAQNGRYVSAAFVMPSYHRAIQKQVLLLDDSPIQLAARQRVLSSAGLEVHVATNANSALALLRSETFRSNIGAIVTDHIMPEVSGPEFVAILRLISPDIPIIVITGLAEAEDEYLAFKNVEFRTKPVQPADLITLVKSKVETESI
jgi:CheY-like chemotaxis protein